MASHGTAGACYKDRTRKGRVCDDCRTAARERSYQRGAPRPGTPEYAENVSRRGGAGSSARWAGHTAVAWVEAMAPRLVDGWQPRVYR